MSGDYAKSKTNSMNQKWNLTANGMPPDHKTCWLSDGLRLTKGYRDNGMWLYQDSGDYLQFSPTHYIEEFELYLPNEDNTNH